MDVDAVLDAMEREAEEYVSLMERRDMLVAALREMARQEDQAFLSHASHSRDGVKIFNRAADEIESAK